MKVKVSGTYNIFIYKHKVFHIPESNFVPFHL